MSLSRVFFKSKMLLFLLLGIVTPDRTVAVRQPVQPQELPQQGPIVFIKGVPYRYILQNSNDPRVFVNAVGDPRNAFLQSEQYEPEKPKEAPVHEPSHDVEFRKKQRGKSRFIFKEPVEADIQIPQDAAEQYLKEVTPTTKTAYSEGFVLPQPEPDKYERSRPPTPQQLPIQYIYQPSQIPVQQNPQFLSRQYQPEPQQYVQQFPFQKPAQDTPQVQQYIQQVPFQKGPQETQYLQHQKSAQESPQVQQYTQQLPFQRDPPEAQYLQHQKVAEETPQESVAKSSIFVSQRGKKTQKPRPIKEEKRVPVEKRISGHRGRLPHEPNNQRAVDFNSVQPKLVEYVNILPKSHALQFARSKPIPDEYAHPEQKAVEPEYVNIQPKPEYTNVQHAIHKQARVEYNHRQPTPVEPIPVEYTQQPKPTPEEYANIQPNPAQFSNPESGPIQYVQPKGIPINYQKFLQALQYIQQLPQEQIAYQSEPETKYQEPEREKLQKYQHIDPALLNLQERPIPNFAFQDQEPLKYQPVGRRIAKQQQVGDSAQIRYQLPANRRGFQRS